ncbi:hypothetical protein RI367_006161 [Sorochytrium milnesiophthora]
MAVAERRSTTGNDDDFAAILDTIHRKFSHIRLDDRRSLISDISAVDIPTLLPQNKDIVLQGINADDVQQQYSAVVKLRKYLSLENISLCIDNALALGINSRLVELLQADRHHDIQYEVAWVLTNICAGNTDQTAAVVEAGAVPVLAQLLRSPCVDVRIQACWCLGNIAGDSPKFRDAVIDAGTVQALLYMHETYLPANEHQSADNLQAVRISTWTAANMCRGARPPPNWAKLAPLCAMLTRVTFVEDYETLVDACWAITRIMHGEPQHVQGLITPELCKRLLDLAQPPAKSTEACVALQSPALRAITNIVSGTESNTQQLLDCGGATILKELLESPYSVIRREALLALSNIAAGTLDQVKHLLNQGIGALWIAMLKPDAYGIDNRQRREVMWSLSNATSLHDFDVAQYLICDLGCIPYILPYIDPAVSAGDVVLLEKAADTIMNLLISGEQRQCQLTSGGAESQTPPLPAYNPFVAAFPPTTLTGLSKIRDMPNLDFRIRRKCDKLLDDLQRAAENFDGVVSQLHTMSLSTE